MSVRWITEYLGTAAFSKCTPEENWEILDVRDLVDKAGNRKCVVRERINSALQTLVVHKKKVVVCCDYGMSRSNAIATGILALYERIGFFSALQRVVQKTGEKQIKLEPLMVVRSALMEDKQLEGSSSSRLLVTGGHGNLGRVLCGYLSGKFDVFAPSSQDIDLFLGCSDLFAYAGEKKICSILHLANPRIYSSNLAIGQTITMLKNVIEVCLALNLPLVYVSCFEVFSGSNSCCQVDENAPQTPKGPYGEAKFLAENLIRHFEKTAGLKCAVLRASLLYGGEDKKPNFLYNFIEKAKAGETIVTHRYLNGEPQLDLLHAIDFAQAIERAVVSNFVGTLNIGTGVLSSTRKIAELIKDILHSSSVIQTLDVDSEIASVAMNSREAKNALGWTPKVALEVGLRHILTGDYERKLLDEKTL